MYVNTGWGGRIKAGKFSQRLPEPWVMDVWRAAGTALDLYAPDLYASNFVEWCRRYHRSGIRSSCPRRVEEKPVPPTCFMPGRGGRHGIFPLRD